MFYSNSTKVNNRQLLRIKPKHISSFVEYHHMFFFGSWWCKIEKYVFHIDSIDLKISVLSHVIPFLRTSPVEKSAGARRAAGTCCSRRSKVSDNLATPKARTSESTWGRQRLMDLWRSKYGVYMIYMGYSWYIWYIYMVYYDIYYCVYNGIHHIMGYIYIINWYIWWEYHMMELFWNITYRYS